MLAQAGDDVADGVGLVTGRDDDGDGVLVHGVRGTIRHVGARAAYLFHRHTVVPPTRATGSRRFHGTSFCMRVAKAFQLAGQPSVSVTGPVTT